ncbi:MAG: DUF2239 family protein [Burkholderiales bacterium]|nr:DUF2239 family protein [Burkholderiales bacterium]MDE2395664.1 DUF2239 family protein [Burkholderiales bacterium]MDE2452689.1 DUF2239 family protein [Burkholderiales bacterium]
MNSAPSYTAFSGHRRIASGPLPAVALAAKRETASGAADPLLVFSDESGRCIDLDLRGSDAEVVARLASLASQGEAPAGATPDAPPEDGETQRDEPRGRGRPRLGVVAREVTLLPRHWEWLATQPGGASVALRKLVEQARRANGDKDRDRRAQERAYHFMSTLAGNLAGFEEASRALFGGKRSALDALIAAWPKDLREHVVRLLDAGAPAP